MAALLKVDHSLTADCGELDYISSAGLGVIMETYKRLHCPGPQPPARERLAAHPERLPLRRARPGDRDPLGRPPAPGPAELFFLQPFPQGCVLMTRRGRGNPGTPVAGRGPQGLRGTGPCASARAVQRRPPHAQRPRGRPGRDPDGVPQGLAEAATYDRRNKFFSWIYRILLNEAFNQLRRRRRMEPLDERMVCPERSPEERTEANEIGAIVQDALMELSTDHRQVIILRHFHHLSHREIGDMLKVPEKTVKSRLYTGRQLLGGILRRRGVRPT